MSRKLEFKKMSCKFAILKKVENIVLRVSFQLSVAENYGGPQLSRQNQKPHGKTKNLTAKTKYLMAKPKTSRQNRKPHGPHGKNKIPHDKTKTKTKDLTAKPKTSRQNQGPHGKTKYFTAKTKYLTAKANTHGKTKAILFLL